MKSIFYMIGLFFLVIISSLTISINNNIDELNNNINNDIELINNEIEELREIIFTLHSKQKKLEKHIRKRVIKATVTAYTPNIDETDDTPYTTAFLKKVNPKYVAVSKKIIRDLNWLPGEKIYIEGIGIRIIADLMSEKYKDEYRIDIFMWKKEDAIKWGKKENTMIVLLNELERIS